MCDISVKAGEYFSNLYLLYVYFKEGRIGKRDIFFYREKEY